MASTIEQVTREIRERAEQVRTELQAKEEAYRRETAGLRQELSRLEAALTNLTGQVGAPERRAASRATSARRAPRGQNKAAILKVVSERAGVSPGEIASATGIASATVYSTVNKLLHQGEVEQVELPGGQKGYRIPGEQSAA